MNKSHITKNLFLIFSLLPFLTSCMKDAVKEAYCFTVVFERQGNNAITSMYCKTSKKDDPSALETRLLTFEGNDFKTALKEADKGDHNIYFNSICSYYISETLTDKDKKEITLLLLNNTKYKTDNSIFLHSDVSSEQLHKFAEDTCNNESIRKTRKGLYLPSIEVFRNLF